MPTSILKYFPCQHQNTQGIVATKKANKFWTFPTQAKNQPHRYCHGNLPFQNCYLAKPMWRRKGMFHSERFPDPNPTLIFGSVHEQGLSSVSWKSALRIITRECLKPECSRGEWPNSYFPFVISELNPSSWVSDRLGRASSWWAWRWVAAPMFWSNFLWLLQKLVLC